MFRPTSFNSPTSIIGRGGREVLEPLPRHLIAGEKFPTALESAQVLKDRLQGNLTDGGL
jgi:hypothetical protein